MLYSDEDYVDENGEPVRPNFKPDWSPELLSNCMYMGHLVLASKELMRTTGGFRSEFDGAQDYDLALRLTDKPVRVAHCRTFCITGGSIANPSRTIQMQSPGRTIPVIARLRTWFAAVDGTHA